MEELDIIWEEALKKSTIHCDNRRYYKCQKFTHFTWNLYHPEDPKIKGDGYIIHHDDENPLNDHISNLKKMTNAEHTSLHHSNPPEIVRKRMSERIKGEKNPMFGRHHSEETRRVQSEAQKGEKGHNYGKRPPQDVRTKISESLKGRYGGNKNPMARIVMAEYMIFTTMNQAAKVFGVTNGAIYWRIKKQKPGYFYLTKKRRNNNE